MEKLDLNFALVEDTRPPIYTAMKYWGKKPHNIWRKYIEHYTPEDGLFLDPCMGSAISIFEAAKINRKAIGFDLNPLSSFMIEILSSKFELAKFKEKVEKILLDVSEDEIYKKFFSTTCPNCGNISVAQSFKWENGKIYEIGVECCNCHKTQKTIKRQGQTYHRYLKTPDKDDDSITSQIEDIQVPFWFPEDSFPHSPSFSANFISCIGGNKFKDLWTRRNLYVLSKIFDHVIAETDETLKKQLVFGFIQSIHLCTKMSVPRRGKADRAFSTSWGRSAYICSARQMEMNPLLVFEGSCFGKQSVTSALSKNYQYIGKKPNILYVDKSNKSDRSKSFDIKYGIIDIQNISDYVDDKSVNFAMVDFPYGGLVQYLDLSSIWLVWMKKLNVELYKPNYDAEITIKRGIQEREIYEKKILNALKQLFKILKDDGKIVFTFHNNKLDIWNSFLKSIALAGFEIEHVIHQQNRRTGEANVANPYGTSASDFYIRCIKSHTEELKTDMQKFEYFVIKKAIEIIALRNEPTPYQLLFNGMLGEISKAGFDLQNFDSNIEKILSKNIGIDFIITENTDNNSGNYWWLINPDKHIKYRDKKLSERVEESIISLLRRKTAIEFDEALAEIFVNYPNGLTPDVKSVRSILSKYARQSGGRWVYNKSGLEKDFNQHSKIINHFATIWRKLQFQIYIGKKEQSDTFMNKKLVEYAELDNLKFLKDYDKEQIKRIEMVDVIWLKNDEIYFAVEVENSTNFSSGIQRCSNLDAKIKKIMAIPNSREQELLNVSDPSFVEAFKKHNWNYMLYMDIERLESKRKITETDLLHYFKSI